MSWVIVHNKSSSMSPGSSNCRYVGQRVLLQTALVIFLLIIAWKVFLTTEEIPAQAMMNINFEEHVAKICKARGKSPIPYQGVQSFFNFLMKPDDDHCYSWIEFGGEKIPIPAQSEKECVDEVRKTKYMCFNEEYEMTKDPCLIYSFGKDDDSQFERDMHMFSCEVHAFDHQKVVLSEHIKRTEFWLEHAWDIADFPYNKPNNNSFIRRRSLDFITTTLGHKGRTIKFIKSDLLGREWILLKQIVLHQDLLDIRQIGAQIHIPLSVNTMDIQERHAYFGRMFQVLQGLTCSGYKYILGRAVKYYRGNIHIPEMKNKTFLPAYEINFAKVLPTNKDKPKQEPK